jgi:hypothetical protein
MLALAALTVTACGREEGARVPLGEAAAAADSATLPPNHPPVGAAGTASRSTLAPAAREAVDRGNAAFRAKRYEEALREYRAAALAAPEHAVPLYGIQMAARALGNSALADSAMRRLRALPTAPKALTDSTMREVHTKTPPPDRTS